MLVAIGKIIKCLYSNSAMELFTSVSIMFRAAAYATYYVLIFFSGVLGMYVSYSVFDAKFTTKGRERIAKMRSEAEELQNMQKMQYDLMMSKNNDESSNDEGNSSSDEDDSDDNDVEDIKNVVNGEKSGGNLKRQKNTSNDNHNKEK